MEGYTTCEFCGLSVADTEPVCPHCGAANAAYPTAAASWPKRVIEHPKTIGELQAYCAEKRMPLEKMRFFVGEDYKQPKAFGIYRDGRSFVVYKNKADGSRAVRYHGPDEAYAVNELFQKLLDECHKRGIYPDGLPDNPANRSVSAGAARSARKDKHSDLDSSIESIQRENRKNRGKKIDPNVYPLIFVILFLVAIFATIAFCSGKKHKNDGYYRGGEGIYYRYGDDWYYSDGYSDWYGVDSYPYDDYSDYYLGKDYESDWGVGNFKDSDIWDDLHSSSDSDSDSSYDNWDSGDTDWDSDW